MDKATYETYEYLPASNSETGADQFFVVEEDGTFLINRQVQYVAEVQDVKEVLEVVQPCTVYDVSSQQFFGDVDNSGELISVSDQFILPDPSGNITPETNLYNNSYLLQSTSANVVQIDEDVVVDQIKEPSPQEVDIDTESQSNTQGTNFTEITITDEQYRTLEQKGWILLEINDKIFVLNSLGLHDITSDEKLVLKLKSEIQNQNAETEPGRVGLNESVIPNQIPSILPSQSLQESNQEESKEFEVSDNSEQDDSNPMRNVQFPAEENQVKTEITPVKVSKASVYRPKELPEPKNEPMETDNAESPKVSPKCLKIKTKLNFRDIPEKVYLGRTVNGKRLVAKVVKRVALPKTETYEPKFREVSMASDDHNGTGIIESEFVNLIQLAVRGRLVNRWTPGDVASAQNVVAQLLKLPNVKGTLFGHIIIVTKVSNYKDSRGVILSQSKPKLVIGRVVNEEDACRFEHKPDLLLQIKESLCDEAGSDTALDGSKENLTMFHIHITETTGSDNVLRVSVMLNKRHLPVDLLLNLKRRHACPVFACGACAATFKSEDLLKEHQQADCLDNEDVLEIETENPTPYLVVEGEKEKLYTCTICNATFQKLCNCKRHIKTHAMPNSTEQVIDDGVNREDSPKKSKMGLYKCKMCPGIYFHSSTLSKHIVTKHISANSDVIK